MMSVVFSYLTSESIVLLDFYVVVFILVETLVTKQLSYKAVVLSDFNRLWAQITWRTTDAASVLNSDL
jgi:hypothetical protein